MGNTPGIPEESMPEPFVASFKAFDKLTGKEREKALAIPEYERHFINEVLTKNFDGARCEVCNMTEDEEEERTLARCDSCGAIVCYECRLGDEDENPQSRVFRCLGCRFHEEKNLEGVDHQHPKCHLCVQKGGVLLPSFANPVNRLQYWRNNSKEFQKTIFAKRLWAHTTCAL